MWKAHAKACWLSDRERHLHNTEIRAGILRILAQVCKDNTGIIIPSRNTEVNRSIDELLRFT